ncbi:MAG: aldehyde dehydrogenase family protein, partial [Verrucomicrobiota bacterium]
MAEATSSDRHYDLEALLEAQRAYFRDGSTRPIGFRQERLRGFANQLEKRADDLLSALAADLGKPGIEAYVSEVWFTLEETRLFAKQLPKWAKPQRVGNPFFYWPARSEIRREPFGNSVVIGPWNYPVQLSLSPLIASVGAGNTVVL